MADGIVCLGSPKPARAGIILGIDPGMSRCGWAMLSYDRDDPTAKPVWLASGVWETAHSKGESIWARSIDLSGQIAETLADIPRHQPDRPAAISRAAVETPAYGSRHSSHNVSHCRGILSLSCALRQIYDIIDITPTELKRRVLGSRKTGMAKHDKQDVKAKLPELIDNVVWQTRWLDESDALAVAYAAWHQNLDGFQSNAPQSADV